MCKICIHQLGCLKTAVQDKPYNRQMGQVNGPCHIPNIPIFRIFLGTAACALLNAGSAGAIHQSTEALYRDELSATLGLAKAMRYSPPISLMGNPIPVSAELPPNSKQWHGTSSELTVSDTERQPGQPATMDGSPEGNSLSLSNPEANTLFMSPVISSEPTSGFLLAQVEGIQRPQPVPEPEPTPLPSLPSLDDLLGPATTPKDESNPAANGVSVLIDRFEIVGNTVFPPEELNAITAPYTNRPVTFAELLEVRSAITQHYVDAGYVTSGAILPPQDFQSGGIVEIQIIEGQLEDIEIIGTEELHPSYVRSRLSFGLTPPLNVDRLLEQLQLLQLDPLIETISADLQTGIAPGTNLLVVSLEEADSFDADYTFDNNRSPSVGSMRHQIQLTEANFLGFGDRLSIGYNHTEGSNGVTADYTFPINPRNGTLQARMEFTDSNVIEEPFDVLKINADSFAYDLTFRQPLEQRPTEEFAVGITGSYQSNQTFLGIGNIGPFPLSPGANSRGRTTVSALRFFQEWTQRSSTEVIALRSQFNLGLDLLNATVNDTGPDGRFLSWQGQGQWVRSLGRDSLLFLQGEVQLTPDSLLTLEQLALGGQATVRGYRQDQLLTDNGVQTSAEIRLPIFRNRKQDILLQVAPFVDFGHGWNNKGNNSETETLIGIGGGLILNVDSHLNARLDYGIPLISPNDQGTLQENGIYFTLNLSL